MEKKNEAAVAPLEEDVYKRQCCMRLEEISINIIVFFMKRSKNLKEELRNRLLRKRVFSKLQLRGFCVYLQSNSRINGIARLEKMDVSYQAENASE